MQHGGPQGGPQGNRDGGRGRMDDRGHGGYDRGGPQGRGDHGPRFARGDRLPGEYRNRQYVIDDYRPYNLSAPPRGYHWVSIDSDFVLAAIATGVVAQVILGR